jgi:SAM-dependent methyltransferase
MPRLEHAASPSSSAESWLNTPLGHYVRECEQRWFDHTSVDIFGFNALQVGFNAMNALSANRMPQHIHVDLKAGGIRAEAEALPFAAQSLDLVACPHVLEFSPHPHQVLREVERVLRPEGHLLITGFNPASLWGLRRKLGAEGYPWSGQFLHLTRVKDWLALLGLEVVGGRMGCYALPINRAHWAQRARGLEAAGDRWWALGGGVYMLHAVKRVTGVRLIMPRRSVSAWSTKSILAPGAGRVHQQREDSKD